MRAFAKPLEGPVSVELTFTFQRPASHWGAKGLKDSAPSYPPRNDFDNLAKAATDPLNGLAYWDDDQICYAVIRRRYAEGREDCGSTVIRISPVASETD